MGTKLRESRAKTLTESIAVAEYWLALYERNAEYERQILAMLRRQLDQTEEH